MNQIRAIQALNKREIEAGISPNASWHVDYRDTAYIYFGGLPYELSEGDVITIFSQFGEPVFLKLVRDKETGKSKGFGWLKYEDQRSTDLAVDNLGGAEIGGRLIRVDHARYKSRDEEEEEEGRVGWEDVMRREGAGGGGDDGDGETEGEEEEEEERPRKMLKEEVELQRLIEGHDDDDPMKGYLVEEKKKEVEEALRRERKKGERGSRGDKERRHRSHRSRRDDDERREKSRRDDKRDGGEDIERRHRHRPNSKERDSRRDRDRESHRHKDDRDRDGSRERRREKRGDSDRKEREHSSREERRHRDSEDRHTKDRKRDRSRSLR